MRKFLSRVLISSLVGCVWACGQPRAEIEEFVPLFLESVYEGTDFYRQYISLSDISVLKISRTNMTDEFEVVGWDRAAEGEFEFAVRFSNGASGIVTVSERSGTIVSAGLLVTPP
jgi:predicted acylesterase/phospholipase RssA